MTYLPALIILDQPEVNGDAELDVLLAARGD